MLSIHALTKSYAGPRPRTVFSGVDLELAAGDYVAVMGESGVGKSTLLNMIAGLDRADAGSIRLDGADLAALDDDALTLLRRSAMGFVFQAFHILPYLTVARERVAAAVAARRDRRRGARAGRRDGRRRRPRRSRRRRCRASSPAANCSASPSPARWCIVRAWC